MRQLPVTLLSLIFLTPSVSSHPTEHRPSLVTWRRWANSLLDKIWQPFQNQGHDVGYHPAAAKYTRDVVLRFNLSSVDEALAIKEAADDLYLDIWEFTRNWVDIRVAKDVVPSLLNLLPPSLSISYVPLIPESVLTSLTTSSSTSGSSESFSPTLRTSSHDLFFADYQRLSVINPWLKMLSNMFKSHVRLVNIGTSYEGREILGIRIAVKHANNTIPIGPRKTILVTAGTHAREWISTSSVNYLAYNLIRLYGRSRIHTQMVDSFDWVFVPVTNPDGYEYTWKTDRLWRKNRQPTPLRFCNGIDLDRSFGFKFDSGQSGNPCSESYAGTEPWEATEAVQLREWAQNQTESGTSFIAYLDLHSYSQQVLYPYSYSCDVDPPSLENLQELAWGFVRAMYHASPSKGNIYEVHAACEGNVAMTSCGVQELPRLEAGGGSALDWWYEEMKVKYSYQIKLRDTGSYGFLLPKEQIVPTGKEVLAAAEFLGKFLLGEIGMLGEEEKEKLKAESQVLKTDSHMLSEEVPEEAPKSPWQDSKLTKLEFRRRR